MRRWRRGIKKCSVYWLSGTALITAPIPTPLTTPGGGKNPYDLYVYLQRSGSFYSSSKGWNVTSDNPFKATITTITTDSITGTFSGRVFWGAATNYLDISNGKFCANF
jgi:hypothetical protein